MPESTKDFLGSGWKFPPCLDSRGRIELAHQEQDVEEAIRIILLTQVGERPMRPEFGSELHLLTFAPNDATTAGEARRYVLEALERWEPRIEIEEVEAGPWDVIEPPENPFLVGERNPGHLLIKIRYRIVATNSERNLVFPFYLIPGEE